MASAGSSVELICGPHGIDESILARSYTGVGRKGGGIPQRMRCSVQYRYLIAVDLSVGIKKRWIEHVIASTHAIESL